AGESGGAVRVCRHRSAPIHIDQPDSQPIRLRDFMRLNITLTRGKDAADVLAITRADGTKTWSRQAQPYLSFHDLAHYVVEATLGMRDGFYGLLAQGWDITAFGDKSKTKDIPAEAIWV